MEKEQIIKMAETLNSGGLSIHNYNADDARKILTEKHPTQNSVAEFDKHAFDVFLELMKIQVNYPS